MPSIRRPDPAARADDPGEILVRRTAIGLAAVTLLLVAALLSGVGLVTAAVALQVTGATVDRSLREAATAEIANLELDETNTEPGQDATEPGEGEGEPAAVAAAEADDHPPESSDTFFLVLDPSGRLVSNPRRVTLAGLPDPAAAAAAAGGVEDWRTVDAGGTRIRLLTQPLTDQSGQLTGLLQAGFVLTLHDEQANLILLTIAAASLVGLAGAAVVSVLVTRRALAPIKLAFASERRFVAAASHELRTPVALIHALAEVLQREALVKPRGQPMVEDMISESDRLARLVGDLLALSSAEAGAIVVEPRQLDAQAVITSVARRVEGVASQRGLSVEVEQPDLAATEAELGVTADPDRLAQLLLIFVDNAMDHSPAGGRIRLRARATSEHGQAQVAIAVADQGPGVPAAERERIFEPFARLGGRRRTNETTGLGLAIARSLAARLGATIRVRDAPGGGAEFSVVLPRLARRVVGDPGLPATRATTDARRPIARGGDDQP